MHTVAETFGASYENIPEIRVLPQIFTLPGASSTVDRKVEFTVTGLSVAGYTPRAVSSTGSSVAAQSENPSTTINGSTASSQTITTTAEKAYWNLAGANSTATTYTITYDVDTTSSTSGFFTAKLWKNTGTSDDSSWSLVASQGYEYGITATGETLSWFGAMALDYDFKMTVAKTGSVQTWTFTAKALTYDKVTSGAETSLTPAGSALLVQAVEKS
jgi:hypothetical protein